MCLEAKRCASSGQFTILTAAYPAASSSIRLISEASICFIAADPIRADCTEFEVRAFCVKCNIALNNTRSVSHDWIACGMNQMSTPSLDVKNSSNLFRVELWNWIGAWIRACAQKSNYFPCEKAGRIIDKWRYYRLDQKILNITRSVFDAALYRTNC